MPDLVFVSPSLEAFGPTIEIEVRVSTRLARILVAQRKPVPPPVAITAVIDTGASWCLFTPDVYSRLKIEPVDVATISTASSTRHESNVYHVDLEVAGHRIRDVMALEAPLAGVPAEGLIGRNFLSRVAFTYDGRINQYTLSF